MSREKKNINIDLFKQITMLFESRPIPYISLVFENKDIYA